MDPMPSLRAALLDLLHETRGDDLKKHRAEAVIEESAQIVATNFSSLTSIGMLRMRESPYCREELQLSEFSDSLQELFPLSESDATS